MIRDKGPLRAQWTSFTIPRANPAIGPSSKPMWRAAESAATGTSLPVGGAARDVRLG